MSVSSRVSAASLVAILATLAYGAADSRPSPSGPRLALVAKRATVEASSVASGRVRIEVRFRTATTGTFAIGGVISDTGSLRAVRRVSGERLQLTEVLAGKAGTMRIRATRSCAGRSGVWQVLSGSGAYKGLSGGGVASGGPLCPDATYPVRATYTGVVRMPEPPPPLPIAQPGRYGGGTSQREEVVFDIEQGGRVLAGLKIQRITVRCSATLTLVQAISLPGPQQLAHDGSFALQSVLPSGTTQSVTGRFTSSAAVTGTASLSKSVMDATNNMTSTCVGSVSWTASLPPPSAQPGKYCGFTHQGPGVCVDVAPNGREVAGFESGVIARCFPGGVPPSEIEITLTFTGSIPIGGHLGFSMRGIAVEGLNSGTASIGGFFESPGIASGTVSLGPSTLEFEGTQYRCFSATGRWEAKRQG